MRLRTKDSIAAFIFLAPVLVMIGLFQYWTIAYTVVISLFKYDLTAIYHPFVGLMNYARILSDPRYLDVLRNTFVYVGGYLCMILLGAFVVALLLNKIGIGTTFFRAAYFIPVITSLVAISLIWEYMYDPKLGLVNWILGKVGLPSQGWLKDEKQALFAVMLASSWQAVGYSILILAAGLKGISAHYYEAAKIDGANSWQQFLHITLPLLKPIILFVLVTQTAIGFKTFTQVFVMTAGGPADATQLMMHKIYRVSFESLHMGLGAALSVVLFGIMLIVTLLELRVFGLRGVD